MSRIGKNGQLSHVAGLILIVVGGLILMLFLAVKFGPKATFDEAINTCRFSVIAQSATEVTPGFTGKKSPLDLNCEKRYVDFYNTKVELGLNPENMKAREVTLNGKSTKRFKALSDSIVDQVVAEELRICKYQFADGKMDIFANDDNIFNGKNICFVCSELRFDKDVKPATFDTLQEYTEKTTFDQGQTYMKYLTEESITLNTLWVQPTFNPDDESQSRYMINSYWRNYMDKTAEQYTDLSIDTSKKYYVFFEKYTPRSGFVTNKENWNVKDQPPSEYYDIAQYWVAIVPAQDIMTYCDQQAI